MFGENREDYEWEMAQKMFVDKKPIEEASSDCEDAEFRGYPSYSIRRTRIGSIKPRTNLIDSGEDSLVTRWLPTGSGRAFYWLFRGLYR